MNIEQEKLRKEFRSAKFRKNLKEKLGTECCNCGSKEQIEYHHVVPISLGGTNKILNIVPLCFHCHKMVHDGRDIYTSNKKTGNVGGQKRKAPENYKTILRDYITCKINKNECADLLGMSSRSFSSTMPWVKEFLEEEQIIKYRNNLLVIDKNANRPEEHRIVGYCIFKDGHKEEYYAS